MDRPIRVGDVHMSAPHIYGLALESLELGEGMSFLNVGSGTGYFSHLVASILGRSGVAHGIELHGSVVSHARERHEAFKAA